MSLTSFERFSTYALASMYLEFEKEVIEKKEVFETVVLTFK